MSVVLVLLSILKFIAIVLLVLILVALFMFFIFLFVPVRYSIQAEKHEDIFLHVKVSYLLRIFMLHFKYEKENTEMVLKIFGIPLGSKKNKNHKKRENTDNTKNVNQENIDTAVKIEKEEKEPPPPEPKPIEPKPIQEAKEESKKEKKRKDKKIDNAPKEEKTNFIEKIKNFYNQVQSVIHYPDRKKIVDLTIQLLKDLLKSLKRTKVSLSGEIGFDQPHITGYVIGFSSIVVGLTGFNVRIKGNFEKEIYDFEANIKGSINSWSIFYPIVHYFFKKPIFKLYKLWRKSRQNQK